MAVLALLISIVAIIVPTVVWSLDKRDRDRDRKDRVAEREQDRTERRAEREAEAAERERVRRTINIALALVTRESANRNHTNAEHWVRVSLTGGDAFSSARVTKLEEVQESGKRFDLTYQGVPFLLGQGNPRYFRGRTPSLASSKMRVEATWAVGDDADTVLSVWDLSPEPW